MEKVRVGVIGLGSWGSCHLDAYSSLLNVEVTALCDFNREILQKQGERYQIEGLYTDADELLRRKDLDLVSVVNFEKDHLQPTLKALASGKHVLVEKPVTTRHAEAIKMWETAQKHNRYLIPGHLMRFSEKYAETYRAINAGEIGKPVHMYLKRTRPKSLFDTYHRIHTVYELTVHDIDIALWYANSRVKTVKAYGCQLFSNGVPQLLWAALEFENGMLAHIQSNWMIPNEARSVMTDSAEILGDQGVIRFDNGHGDFQIWNSQGRITPDLDIHANINGRIVGSLRTQLEYVCNCLSAKREPVLTSFPDAIHGIEVADAIIESIKEGKEIKLG